MTALVDVVTATAYSGRGSLLGEQGRRRRWWKLTLACGHVVHRDVRYRPAAERVHRSSGGRGWGTISMSDAFPAPKRARCDACRERSAE